MATKQMTGPKIRILMLTHNRPQYTRLALDRLCETISGDTLITVWDNGSTTETVDLLREFEGRQGIGRIVFNKTNDKLRGPTNWFWRNNADADYICKVDDDCLMPPKWCETLVAAHTEVPDFGVIGCWSLLSEDFDFDLARRKIHSFGRHQILRNCWVEGSGYLMKRAMRERLGYLQPHESFTDLCIRGAAAGFINGWYYPLLCQEHMDDPRAAHTGIHTDEDFKRIIPLSAETFNVKTREEWINRLKAIAHKLQICSYDPRHYIGWRARMVRGLCRLAGRTYLPRA